MKYLFQFAAAPDLPLGHSPRRQAGAFAGSLFFAFTPACSIGQGAESLISLPESGTRPARFFGIVIQGIWQGSQVGKTDPQRCGGLRD